jgi:O-antigen/teichoic acid export membrane protein
MNFALRRIRSRTHRVSVRFGLTAIDQGISSLSNFAVGVAVARIAGIAALGAYSLAYVIWLVMADLHRSLVTDPMAIENDVHQPDATERVRVGLAAELSIGFAMGAVCAGGGLLLLTAGQHAYGVCLLALSPWIPVLLAQDYWRWIGFMSAKPGRALANDVLFVLAQVLCFALLYLAGLRSSVLAIEAWGLGAAAGALFGLGQFSILPTARGGMKRLRQRWPLSKWLVSGSLTTWGASQGYVILTGAILGPVGLGGLRAALSLVSGPSVVLLQAGGSVGLPEASRALKERGWPGLRRVERIITGAALASVGAVGLIVLAFGRQLLVFLYGHQFARFAGTADLLVLSVFLGAMGVGAVLCLKTTKLTKFVFRQSAMSLVVSMVGVAVLVPIFGVVGAAGAAVARSTTSMLGAVNYHRRWSRRTAEQMGPVPVAGTDKAVVDGTPIRPASPSPGWQSTRAVALSPVGTPSRQDGHARWAERA